MSNKTHEQLDFEKHIQSVIEYYKDSSEGINQMIDFSVIDSNLERKEVQLQFVVEQWQLNPIQTFHGGMMATCFDIGFGLLTRCLTNENLISTINLAISYLRPVKLQDELIVVVRANMVGKTIIHLVGEACVKEKMVASATSSFILLEQKN